MSLRKPRPWPQLPDPPSPPARMLTAGGGGGVGVGVGVGAECGPALLPGTSPALVVRGCAVCFVTPSEGFSGSPQRSRCWAQSLG